MDGGDAGTGGGGWLARPIVELPAPYRPRWGGRSKISGRPRGVVKAGIAILSTLGRLWCERASRRGLDHAAAWVDVSSRLLPVWIALLLIGAWMVRSHGGFLEPAAI